PLSGIGVRPGLGAGAPGVGLTRWGGVNPPYYRGWYGGSWGWNGPVWWGAPGAVAAGWMLGSAADFVNPYYVAPAVETTVIYDYSKTYDQQLKDLTAYVDSHPKDAPSRFVLAYHCLVLDQRAQAVKLLNQVVAINPNAELSKAMSTAISQSLEPVATDRPSVA